jgi:Zn finger protein HypA/HybF involved in hydrogenase expression
MDPKFQYFDEYDEGKDIFENEISNTVKCLICQESIPVRSELAIDQFLTCPRCGGNLEVVQVKPVVLDWS